MTDDDLLAFAHEYIDAAGGVARAGMCYPASWTIARLFGDGIRVVSGDYDGFPHTWNVLPDGRIFDATHGQFDGGPPRFFPAGAPGFETAAA